jgi:hypothetical protein
VTEDFGVGQLNVGPYDSSAAAFASINRTATLFLM